MSNKVRHAQLNVITGPMFCGKSTELLRRLNISAEMGQKVLYVNHSSDNRSDTPFSTHNPSIVNIGKISGIKISNLEEITRPENWDVIGIDEAQFFTDENPDYLRNHILHWVEKKNIQVIVAGLNGDSNRNLFGQIYTLLPICDSWDLLSSFCVNCCKNNFREDAKFSHKISDTTSNVVEIGGKDKYVPLCRACYCKSNDL